MHACVLASHLEGPGAVVIGSGHRTRRTNNLVAVRGPHALAIPSVLHKYPKERTHCAQVRATMHPKLGEEAYMGELRARVPR
jgi:hypothetical protein